MQITRDFRWLVALTASGIFGAACQGEMTTDAGDASDIGNADVAHDNVTPETSVDIVDVPVVDVVDVQQTDATDTGADAGACTGTVDPLDVWTFKLGVIAAGFDYTEAGAGMAAGATVGGLKNAPNATPADGMVDGDCFGAPTLSGSTARDMAPEVNYGTVEIVTSAGNAYYDYDTTMSAYHPNSSRRTLGMEYPYNTPVTINFPGDPDAGLVAGTATLTFPPQVTATTFTVPTTFSRTAPTVIPYTVPSDLSGGLYTVLLGSDAAGNNFFVCAVPACRGSITVPASMIAPFSAGGEVDIQVGFQRTTTIPPTSRTPAMTFGTQYTKVFITAAM